ncbi:unnamed protein product [Microthlaspi erraticum]|uniref:Uncharacterized protein n=1 Tax=Microthlaspi erraticum TaxID=1685480 RepID=A0A6D2JUK9_9BRAS|nr:unnamed protein product [Microthlaspi erraticum]
MFPSADKYLVESVAVDKWARCHFKGEKYNLDTSNTCESLNSVFRKERKLHLLPMIDAIVNKMAFWFNKHRKEAASLPEAKVIVPFVENVLHERCPIATCLTVSELNNYEFEYSVIGNDKVT